MSSETIIITMEDDLVHTSDNPYCDDPTCPCHMDEEGALQAMRDATQAAPIYVERFQDKRDTAEDWQRDLGVFDNLMQKWSGRQPLP